MKSLYVVRKPSDAKFIHVQSSGYKAMNSWHMLRTLQVRTLVCRVVLMPMFCTIGGWMPAPDVSRPAVGTLWMQLFTVESCKGWKKRCQPRAMVAGVP